MKFALVEGKREEATKGLVGSCVGCGREMVAKCGTIKVNHWAHRSKTYCDHWWEPETEWHRDWKNLFPISHQEVRHTDDSGIWHIADVKTSEGWVIEFQNSPIDPHERDTRNAFYKKIVWVVNGLRLEKDKEQFIKALNSGTKIMEKPLTIKVFNEKSPLLKKWSDCKAPVFFDFGKDEFLWCALPASSLPWRLILHFKKHDFVGFHQGGEMEARSFQFILDEMAKFQGQYVSLLKEQERRTAQRLVLRDPLLGFQQYRARRKPFRRF